MGNFLCDDNMVNDRKIQKLINEFGEGAGFVFIRLLAHVKKAQDCGHIIFVSEQWFRKFEAESVTELETIKKIFDKLAELELIDPLLYKNEGIIFLPKYIKRHANYFKQLQRRDTYSGKNLRERLRSGFNDREHKDSFSLTFDEFALVVSESCLRHGLEMAICTSISINNKLIYNIYNENLKNEKEKIALQDRLLNSGGFTPTDLSGIAMRSKEKVALQDRLLNSGGFTPTDLSGIAMRSKEKSETTELSELTDKANEKDKWKKKIVMVMYENVKRLDPNYPKLNLQKWAKVFDLPEIKEREQGEIEKVLLYSQHHKYWHKKILTPYDLVNSFTKILLDMNDPNTNNANNGTQYTYSKIAPETERYSPKYGGEPVLIGDFIKQEFGFFEDCKKLMAN